uniref:Podocan n=1 Tax=Myotis myotis TaxID=51298 RepID=A0A7J8A091_MYOMY|nr:podocan [Myotis myotis]
MARSRALLLLLLLPPQLQLGLVLAVRAPVFGRNGAHNLSPEENEFVEEEPVLVLRPEEPGPGPATINCPRDCACSQEGVVDCGGIDLREFPGDLPEHINHLSLQNNQLEKIYPEELSRLHRLETLNLQNNRLTSRGEGSPRAGAGHRAGESPTLRTPGVGKSRSGLGGSGSWMLPKSHP